MSRRANFLTLALVAASTPAALGLEALLRHTLMPAATQEFREWLAPQITPFAWGLVALAAVTVLGALAAQPQLVGALSRRLDREARVPPEQRQARARFETLMIVASVTQVPALLAAAASMFGADLLPAALTVGIGTAGVLAQWAGAGRG